MSGGSLGYFYCTLEDHVGDFGDKELDELVKDLAELFHDREWYLSAATCIGSWNEARDRFKEKWFTELGRTERIDRYLEELSDEVRKSFGISKKYCKNCKHWTGRDDGRYGDCTFHEHRLMHRLESCHRFAESEVEE